MSSTWTFAEFYTRKAAWSLETFGPAQTTAGVAAHMRKELDELRVSIANPGRKCGEIDAIREELSDICLLAIELSWRGGGDASDFGEIVGERDSMSIASAATYVGLHLDAICRGVMGARAGAVVIWDIAFRALSCNPAPILEKFEALQTRTWPDWRTVAPDHPIEHVREVDGVPVLPTGIPDGARLSDDGHVRRVMAVRDHVRTPSLDETMQRCSGVLSALAPHDGGGSLEARLTTMAAERDEARSLLAQNEAAMDEILAERDAARRALELERADNLALRSDLALAEERVSKERKAWHDSDYRIRQERDRVTAERDAARRDFEVERKRAASVIDLDNRVRDELGARPEESTATVARIAVNERNAIRAELDRRDGSCAELVTERDVLRAEFAKLTVERDEAQERRGRAIIERDALLLEEKDWRADNERLRLERDDVRKVLSAQPNETVTMAVQRVTAHREELINNGSAKMRSAWDALCEAMSISRTAGSAHAVERAGQLRDDSVAYRSLRGRLVEMLGCPADFSEKDVADMVADRINGPITDAEDDLLEQVQQLEGDVTTLKAALHVATRGRS